MLYSYLFEFFAWYVKSDHTLIKHLMLNDVKEIFLFGFLEKFYPPPQWDLAHPKYLASRIMDLESVLYLTFALIGLF